MSSHNHGGKGSKGKAEQTPRDRLERLLTRTLRYGMLTATERIEVTGTCGLYSMAHLATVEPRLMQFTYEELHEVIGGVERRLDNGQTTGRFMMMVSVGVVNVGLMALSEADHSVHGYQRTMRGKCDNSSRSSIIP